MRIINKKYLLIIILVGIILTGVIVSKPKENAKLDNVILKQEVNSKTFAMYKEEGNEYVPVEDNKFPEMYVLNLTESKCIDNNGNEIKDALSYENDKVVLTTNKSSYCYLYFDKSLGLEIKDKVPNGLKIDKERGEMYRFQGQQADGINNYICFGTSDKELCKKDTNHYMYRIIGIEAETGRVKVIKKEALKETEDGTYQWYTDYDHDITFPDSNIYKAISESKDGSKSDFLGNTAYVPNGWYEKIATNTWTHGDMLADDSNGTRQVGVGLYETELGQKETNWYIKAIEGEEEALPSQVYWSENIKYFGQTLYYKRETKRWDSMIKSKIGLVYLSDYYLSISDEVNCSYYEGENSYSDCKLGWLHDLQSEWVIDRMGWTPWDGAYGAFYIDTNGFVLYSPLSFVHSIRPVFYINAFEKLLDGEGTLDNPFIIS